jgi:hypothetical protein
MANNIPFQSCSKTYQANATTVSQTITITPDGPCNQVLVASHEPTSGTGKPVYFRISNLANVTVTAPSPGNPQYAFVAAPCTIKSYTIPYQFSPSAPMYIAFLTESGTAECYFTAGEGV